MSKVSNEIPTEELEAARELIQESDPDATVLIIGSAARSKMNWRSDVDLMVISARPLQRLHAGGRFHIHLETRDGFVARLGAGDEFVAWAVRFGVLLSDPTQWWQRILSAESPWPDWRQKIPHIRKRLRTARKALVDGDDYAAEEELIMAASHCARAVLLSRNLFPLSRPELPTQLTNINPKLSGLLSSLIRGGQTVGTLKSAFSAIDQIYRSLRLTAATST